jgi:hypothetical protein
MLHRKLIIRLALVGGIGMTSGCSSIFSTTPPRITDANQLNAASSSVLQLSSVRQNVIFARKLVEMYDSQVVDLRDAGYWSTVPLYAAAIATGAVLAHGANTNVLIDIGLGTGGYYALTQSLDFSGRADVLTRATKNWTCFANAAGKVDFIDPRTGTNGKVGAVLSARRDRLSRNVRSAIAYQANGGDAPDDVLKALGDAITLGRKAEPAAQAAVDAADDALSVLEEFRDEIERKIKLEYYGRLKPFDYDATLGSLTGSVKKVAEHQGEVIKLREALDRSLSNDPNQENESALKDIQAPGGPEDSVAVNPASPSIKEQRADEKQSKIDNMNALGATLAQTGRASRPFNAERKMRALTYIINETVRQITEDTETPKLLALRGELAKCVP